MCIRDRLIVVWPIPLVGKFVLTSKIIRNLKQKPLPTFVITTGRRMAGISIAIKKSKESDLSLIMIDNSSKSIDSKIKNYV